MKPKKLKKRIQQLEKRLQEGTQKLARLRRKLQESESAKALKAAENRLPEPLLHPGSSLQRKQPKRGNRALPRKRREN